MGAGLGAKLHLTLGLKSNLGGGAGLSGATAWLFGGPSNSLGGGAGLSGATALLFWGVSHCSKKAMMCCY